VNDDNLKGYGVGSLWTLDDNTTYVCSDATTGAAVWKKITGGLLFNGGVEVATSRDLNASDAGKILFIVADDVELTMPSTNPFKDNDTVAVFSFANNVSIETEFGGDKRYLFGDTTNKNQCVIFQMIGELFLNITSGFIYDSTDTKVKSIELYLYENRTFKGTFSEPSAIAQTDFVVTIPEQTDTSYEVFIQGKNPLSAVLYSVADADKTTTSFTVKTAAGLTGVVEFGYILKP
jgi:hypothetical protein